MSFRPTPALLTRLRFFPTSGGEWLRHAQRPTGGYPGGMEQFLHRILLGGDWNNKLILESGHLIYWTRCFFGVVETEEDFLRVLRQVEWDKEALMPPHPVTEEPVNA